MADQPRTASVPRLLGPECPHHTTERAHNEDITRWEERCQELHARPFLLVTGRSWRGTAFGGTKGRTQLPPFVDRFMAGRIKLDEMVSATLLLEEINTAYDRMPDCSVIRSVVRF